MNAPANTPASIPVALLRDLAARLPLPVDARAFVDLAAFVAAGMAPPAVRVPASGELTVAQTEDLAAELRRHWSDAPARLTDAADFAAPPAECKGSTWDPADMQAARDILAAGGRAEDVAFALARPIETTRQAIKRFALRAPLHPAAATGEAAAPALPRTDSWSEAEIAQLVQMKAAGAKLGDIAAALGRGAPACRKQLGKLRGAGVCKVAQDAVWTPEQEAELRRLRATGRPWRDVAAALGRSERAVQQKLAKLKRADRAAASTPADIPAGTPADIPAGTPADIPARIPPLAADPAPEPAPPPIEAAPGTDLARVNDLLQAAYAAGLPSLQRKVLRHLLTLPEDFTPADDLALVEDLLRRRPAAEIGADLGCSGPVVLARWRSLVGPAITDRLGRITIDGQAALLAVLRWLANAQEAADV